MTESNTADIARVAASTAVRGAAREAARLAAMWPLADAMRMDNDAKYAENLQVRVTRAFARILTGEDVTVPDAEFVYEGADAIPGRPQAIVDALLAANDAYDAMADFSETGDAALVDDVASDLGVTWDDAASVRVHDTLDAVEAAVGDGTFDAGEYALAAGDADAAVPADDDAFEPPAALVGAMARRSAVALAVCDALIDAVTPGDVASGDRSPADDAVVRAVLPVLLVANELREQIAVPRICLTDAQIRELLAARAAAVVRGASTLDATAAFVAPLAAAEWAKHREDVLWDPAEAKKRAKEEDEKRNKEALAAKFAHVKDDPGKETVEL